ncbi:MAG: hypothetical protein MUO76_18110 [Anaerolineaceae bacterium]|nr:hypothetical protein [Anaerolineaceae bacterium]
MMKIENVLKLIEDVPDYETFLTVDELNESAQVLAEKYPDIVSWLPIGSSRAGEEIRMLKIGDGSKNALLFAMPHPNEPIGSMMLEFLSTRLAEDDELREGLGYTWHMIKCIDVDGTRLNEGWFKGPYSVTNYARNYYRPPSFQQIEWTFPIEYKTLRFDKPLPETKALMKIIEDKKPEFIFSLHNSGFGGAYLYVSHNRKDFFRDFYELVESQELPLHLGEPEMPFVEQLSDAVFRLNGISEGYDFLEKNSDKDPAEVMRGGADSFEYARRFCDPFFLVCEMPYFNNPIIHDTSPTEHVRRDLIMQNIAATRKQIHSMKELFDSIQEELTLGTAFKETIENDLTNFDDYLAAQENWAKSDSALSEKATEAEKFDNLLVSRFYQLLSLGTFVRMIKAQIEETGVTELLTSALETAIKTFEKEAAELENEMRYDVIPIKKLVSVQLGSALLASEVAASQ